MMEGFRPKVSTILIAIGLFLFFLLFTFPYQNLRGYIFGKIYSTTNILIAAEEIYPSFFGWPGMGLKNVDVSLPLAGKDLELSCKKLIFRVGLAGLFPPTPSTSLSLKTLKKGGDLYVKFSQNGNAVRAVIDANDVNLEQLALPGLSEPLLGKVSADGDVHIDSQEMTKSSGKLDLGMDNLRTPAQNFPGFMLPAIKLGALKSKINIKNGIAEISTFTFGSADSDIKGSLVGDARLGRDIYGLFLNLTLRLQLSDSFRNNPQAVALVSLLEGYKTAAGDYAMKWSASIGDMQTNLITAIPQKVTN